MRTPFSKVLLPTMTLSPCGMQSVVGQRLRLWTLTSALRPWTPSKGLALASCAGAAALHPAQGRCPLDSRQALPPCTRLGGQSSKPPHAKAGLSIWLDNSALRVMISALISFLLADIFLISYFDSTTAGCCNRYPVIYDILLSVLRHRYPPVRMSVREKKCIKKACLALIVHRVHGIDHTPYRL